MALSACCLRYCKSTIFQANHNHLYLLLLKTLVVCDTAKVRFFKQITTVQRAVCAPPVLFAILQKYDFSSKSQRSLQRPFRGTQLFAILQKYDFSSKSQLDEVGRYAYDGCLRYCKSTIFQANHNTETAVPVVLFVVCDTAKVRFFKQITTTKLRCAEFHWLFAILQKYDFSSKSQLVH